MEEVWRDIKGYEGFYQVSNYGRVRSLDRMVKYKNGKVVKYNGIILKFGLQKQGYCIVQLFKNGIGCTNRVHRLVWEAFNGKIPEGMQVNHINEIKTDNRLSNLNLMTCRENNMWGTAINRRVKKKSKPITQFDLNGNFIKEWVSAAEVERQLGYCSSHIRSSCKGKRKTSNGYIWKYKN